MEHSDQSTKPETDDGRGNRRSSRPGIVFDDVHWPILRVRFDGTATDDEFEVYLDRLDSLLARRQRYAIVFDLTTAHFTPLAHLRLQAGWLRAHRAEIFELCAGVAFVFSSRIFRVAISAVFALQPLPVEHGSFATLEEGVRWAASHLGCEPPVLGLVWTAEDTTRRFSKR